MKLDQTDKKIIQLLGADARMSNNQMAKVIGVTEGTVRNRIQKLIENKIIKISVINNINRMENPSVALNTKTGKLSLKATLGTVRYASGQIAKNSAQNISIKTPTATVSVRGTDFAMTIDEIGSSTIILLPSCNGAGNCFVSEKL